MAGRGRGGERVSGWVLLDVEGERGELGVGKGREIMKKGRWLTKIDG